MEVVFLDMFRLRNFRLPFLALVLIAGLVAEARVLPVPVPQELRSTRYKVEINGKPIDVAHAAANYDYVNFDTTGAVTVSITSSQDGFWDHGVDIQPWRLGIRPTVSRNTIRFRLKTPAKLSISRPDDFLNHARMLFLFASHPLGKAPAASATVHIIAPGIHKGSLNPKSGETYYLTPGAVILGSLNLWKVHDVKVLGRGVIVYDGPQNPQDDDGWMQKPDWHCVGAMQANRIEINGVTCLVRSRTWSIQMKDSTNLLYENVRVIGGNPGNANQDGMDWLGGGDTIVRDSFFRASDDVFAMQGNWDGYTEDEIKLPGHDVSNILVEHSVLSTSISNIVRAGWPQKSFNSRGFTLRDSDILHGGIGSCGPPFALFTFWGAEGATGSHSGYTFENLWLDDWYSLFQMEQEQPGLHGFTFRNIWALEQPPLVTSEVRGPVTDIRLENVKYEQTVITSNAHLPLSISDGAQQPVFAAGDKRARAQFKVTPAVVQTGTHATFTADKTTDPHARYTWLFGDGTTARGRQIRHRFVDARGTELNATDAAGAGRFRVLLQVESKAILGEKRPVQDWAEHGVVVVAHWHEAAAKKQTAPGLNYNIYPGTWPDFPTFVLEKSMKSGTTATLDTTDTGGFTHYAAVYDGFIDVPQDGGYQFALMARDGAQLTIDGVPLAQTGPPFAEVCGSHNNAVRYAQGSIGLRAGKHVLQLKTLQSISQGTPRLLWAGPGIGLTDIPAKAFSHGSVVAAAPKAIAAKTGDVTPKP
ncbi:PKD domain-containing protein [Acidicapsa ligni]|uniref:PKD domain-containing protein n=1 Tax=Acidicapsa ligni TaxID=542300 RepID=UPI0021DFECD6|nr:PKD domain-containing protein [Acidicapsa ligni]